MLGFGPISSRSISGSPFHLIGYSAAIAGSVALSFTGSASWGARIHASGSASLRFSPSATWSSRNAMSGTTTLTFDSSGLLILAGKPIIFYAMPERLEFVGQSERYLITAKAENFTFRGMR